MSQLWLADIPSSPEVRDDVRSSRTRSKSRPPSNSVPFTPAQPRRRTPSVTPPSAAQRRPMRSSSVPVDPVLSGRVGASIETLGSPPSTQARATLGGKQPKRLFVEDVEGDQGSSSSLDEENDSHSQAKRRRLAQSTGEKLGLSEQSISDAKQFSTMRKKDQNIHLFCMLALLRDNQLDAMDAWTPGEEAIENIKAVAKAVFLSPTLSHYKGDTVVALIMSILMERDLGLPDDCFTNPAKRGALIRIIKYWCTETRSDYKKTTKAHTFGPKPSNISELAEALLSKTNPRLADSFELWARLAVLRGTLQRHDHEKYWDEVNNEMAAIRARARAKYPGESEGNERAQHIHKEFKKALLNDYKEFGEPSLVQEPPSRSTLKVSEFQALVDNAAAKSSGAGNVEIQKPKPKKKKGGKKK